MNNSSSAISKSAEQDANRSFSDSDVATLLDMTPKEIEALLARLRDVAKRKIELILPEPESDGTPSESVKPDDNVVVLLHQIEINSLFSDREQERGEQEGAISLVVNNRENSFAWKRSGYEPDWTRFKLFENDEKSVLFAGKIKKFLKLDFGLIESEDPEELFAQRIADLLKIAAGVTGLVPGYGTAIGAGLSLGAAIAELIKATLEDDKELRYMAFLGKPLQELKYGTYTLMRHPSDTSKPDIAIQFGVHELSPPVTNTKNVLAVLDSIDLTGISGLKEDDRVFLEATMTASSDPDEGDGDSLVTAFSLEHPFRSRKKPPAVPKITVDFHSVVKIDGQVLYDGPWGDMLAFHIGVSGIPKDMHEEQWLQVLKQTGEVIKAVVTSEDKATVGVGFDIAQNAAGALVKFLPDLRFATTQSGLFVKTDQGGGFDCLREINPDKAGPQSFTITLWPPGYGTAKFNFIVWVTDLPSPGKKLPRKLIRSLATGHVTETFKWTGGPGLITAYGDWSSKTNAPAPHISIEISTTAESDSWAAIDPPITFTENGHANFQHLSPGVYVRAVLQNAGDGTKLTCVLDAADRDQLLADILDQLETA